ncbi:hypothetical protein NQ318_021081 [Aromia moschata]|uniref:DDE Tnp4 domain-containing protein n=1 Tax=Aromia moschata TaxID=1265417 RepID=A0AAV8YBV0_9CUCU|nr:hypothetical protein NQ318_021081 [Aromia moschata]
MRLCKARRVVENAFGILVQKWRIFFRPIATKVETTILIIKTTCILHNFLRIKQSECENFDFSDPSDKPSQQSVLRQLQSDPRRTTNLAFSIREQFFFRQRHLLALAKNCGDLRSDTNRAPFEHKSTFLILAKYKFEINVSSDVRKTDG